MANDKPTSADACPVDHETRAAWLKSNAQKNPFPVADMKAAVASDGNSCDSKQIDQAPAPAKPGLWSRFFGSSATTEPEAPSAPKGLGTQRVVSTIPRTADADTSGHASPANSEGETGVSKDGNWIYPSEKMFFDAMKRKGHDTQAADMKTIVPIHNAVNERAWKEIKDWERPYGSDEKCGGPRLHSFMGLSRSMTPRARMKTWLGYTAPFDRHDWTVDRCGTTIEYVIDFYPGKAQANGLPSFYLDVRPKLNSFEGWKMRAAKFVGFV